MVPFFVPHWHTGIRRVQSTTCCICTPASTVRNCRAMFYLIRLYPTSSPGETKTCLASLLTCIHSIHVTSFNDDVRTFLQATPALPTRPRPACHSAAAPVSRPRAIGRRPTGIQLSFLIGHAPCDLPDLPGGPAGRRRMVGWGSTSDADTADRDAAAGRRVVVAHSAFVVVGPAAVSADPSRR